MAARQTRVIYWGMGINLACMVLLIMIAVVLQAPGAQAAITALTLSFVSEMLFLQRAMRISRISDCGS